MRASGHHLVLNHAGDGSEDRTGNAAPYCLANESADIDVVAYTGHHGN